MHFFSGGARALHLAQLCDHGTFVISQAQRTKLRHPKGKLFSAARVQHKSLFLCSQISEWQGRVFFSQQIDGKRQKMRWPVFIWWSSDCQLVCSRQARFKIAKATSHNHVQENANNCHTD